MKDKAEAKKKSRNVLNSVNDLFNQYSDKRKKLKEQLFENFDNSESIIDNLTGAPMWLFKIKAFRKIEQFCETVSTSSD